MRPYSPGGALNALAAAQGGSIPPTPSAHRLRLGLPGYLIPFAPLAFAPQRQLWSREPPSPPVFLQYLRISPLHWEFHSSPTLKPGSFQRSSGVKLRDFTSDLPNRLRALTPNNSEQRLLPTYYRGCWHVVSRNFFCGYRQTAGVFVLQGFFPTKRALRPEGLHHSRGVAASGFPPLRKIPTAASRRSLARVSVPVWPYTLSAGYPSSPW